MIEFENVTAFYENDKPVLNSVSFTEEKGETIGLIGANGAGKTTLMRTLLGLLPHEGLITVDDIPVSEKTLHDVRRKLGFVLQNSDNQMFMPTVYEDMIFGPLNYGLNREEVDARVDEVLTQLNLTELKHCYNHKLSGGEKRMASIATILVMKPEIILMDEPTSALDPKNRRLVINTINEMPETKLISSHDLDMIWDTCDRVILLNRGTIVADGSAKDILQNKELLEDNRMELPLRFSNS